MTTKTNQTKEVLRAQKSVFAHAIEEMRQRPDLTNEEKQARLDEALKRLEARAREMEKQLPEDIVTRPHTRETLDFFAELITYLNRGKEPNNE